MKYPYLQLFTGDWLKDPALTICTPAARGVWIDLLCAMHELDRSGELRGTREQLARVARCSTVDLTQALTELQTTRAAELHDRNGVVTVTNRRMKREAAQRENTRSRVERLRLRNAGVSPPVTPHISEVIVHNSEPLVPPPDPPRGECAPAQDEDSATNALRGAILTAWNATQGVCRVDVLTPKRRAALNARMAEAYFRDHWQEGMARVAGSSFCTGGGQRGWRADLDWFLRPGTIVSLLEGKYDDHAGNGNGAAPRPMTIHEARAVADACTAEIERLKADRSSWHYDGGVRGEMKPECVKQLQRLKARREAARRRITAA